MRSRPPSRARLAALAGALALALAQQALGVNLTGIGVSFDPGNSPNFRDDAGTEATQIRRAVTVLSSSGTAFQTRYQAGVYADSGGTGAVSSSAVLNAAYTITFTVTNAAGSAWRLDLTSSRVGARTAVDDGTGESAFALGAVTGTRSGPGSLTSGSLGLPAIANSQQGTGVDLPFNQTQLASISGTGNGTILLSFNFTATVQSLVIGDQGDEAAIRMGLPETLSSFTAGMYPGNAPTGVPNRTAANDGHFVSLTLFDLGPIPEPDTALLLGLGLALLAARRRAALRSL